MVTPVPPISGDSHCHKNPLFAKYGHDCEMANELDVIPMFISGNTKWDQIRRTLIRIRTVSEINKKSARFFRSQGAIAGEKYRHLSTHPNIIHPFSDIRTWWQCLMCVVFFVQFISTPLDVAFFSIPQATFFRSTSWKSSRMILDILCSLDVGLNFITGYYNFSDNEAVLEPDKIAKKYFKSYFIIDALSSLPTHIDLFIYLPRFNSVFVVLQIVSLLKILRFVTFSRYCEDIFEILDLVHSMRLITRIVSGTIVFVHFMVCALLISYAFNKHYVTDAISANAVTDNPDTNILSKSNKSINKTILHDASYTEALYTALLITSMSGYGKIAPELDNELILVIVMWVLGKFVTILLIGRLRQIVRASTSAHTKYIEMVRLLQEYMHYKQLPDYMQKRLLTYYEFRFQKKYFRESEILNTISGELRQELVMHSCRKLVENVIFFKNLPINLLVRIVSCLHSEIFLVNDVVVRANTAGNSMFFISSGTVAIYTASGREICHLEDGAHFGEIALVMRDELRVASVVAVEVCELYRLDRKDFVRAIHPYPDLLDNIQRIAADRMERTTMLDEHNRREQASKRLY